MSINIQKKYFVGSMYVMYDGKEFPSVCLYEAASTDEALKMHHENARHWVSDNGDQDGNAIDGFHFEAGAFLVKPEYVTEISHETYQEMRAHL